MDTAEHPELESHGPKCNVNLLKLDVNFFHLMILYNAYLEQVVNNYSKNASSESL